MKECKELGKIPGLLESHMFWVNIRRTIFCFFKLYRNHFYQYVKMHTVFLESRAVKTCLIDHPAFRCFGVCSGLCWSPLTPQWCSATTTVKKVKIHWSQGSLYTILNAFLLYKKTTFLCVAFRKHPAAEGSSELRQTEANAHWLWVQQLQLQVT